MILIATNIIMFISMYPILFILYYLQKSAVEGSAKKGILFGISCSQWLPAQDRDQILMIYSKQRKHYLYVFALLPVSTFFIPYFSINLTMWFLWILAISTVLHMVPFAQGFNRVQKLKAMYALPEDTRDSALYELKEAGCVRTLLPQELIPPAMLNLALIPLALYCFQGTEFQTYSGTLFTVMAFCTLLLLVCGLWMDQTKTQVISHNSDMNINFTRTNKKLWKQFWLASCWLATIYSYFLFIYFMLPSTSRQDSSIVLIISSITLSLLMLAVLLWFLLRKRKLDRLYTNKQDFSLSDEDRGWIGGVVYYNPHDNHILVPQKMSCGSTFNLATPVGKGYSIFGALCLLLGFGVCVWLMLDEFTPIQLSLQGDALVAEHTGTEFTVPLEDMVSMTLLEELPKTKKVSGTGMPNLSAGTFRNSVDGRVKVLLNPKLELFLRVETQDTVYYFTGSNDEVTQNIYDRLTQAMP